jgi:hypothetical protein
MANLQYKLEYQWDQGEPSDAGVYVQLRDNVPVYRSHTDKEDYDVLPDEEKHAWLTGLFNISGVTEVSSRAYRVWIMKSPVYSWNEVILPSLHFMKEWFSYDDIEELSGSAKTDGSGLTLNDPKNRRNR